MGAYQNFLSRMNAGGTVMRSEQIQNAKYLLQETFADDPSYVKEGAALFRTGRVLHPRIYLNTYRSTSPAQANIQTMIDEPFYMGDIVLWPEHGYWLCLHSNNLHGIQWEGTLLYCNHTVRFLSPLNKEILEYPVAVFNATQYGSGETNYNYLTLGTSRLIVYLFCDEHTVLIDSGFRFFMDKNPQKPTVFEVKQADSVSCEGYDGRGYLYLVLSESQFNPETDNKELGIANYVVDETGSGIELKENPDLWV